MGLTWLSIIVSQNEDYEDTGVSVEASVLIIAPGALVELSIMVTRVVMEPATVDARSG